MALLSAAALGFSAHTVAEALKDRLVARDWTPATGIVTAVEKRSPFWRRPLYRLFIAVEQGGATIVARAERDVSMAPPSSLWATAQPPQRGDREAVFVSAGSPHRIMPARALFPTWVSALMASFGMCLALGLGWLALITWRQAQRRP